MLSVTLVPSASTTMGTCRARCVGLSAVLVPERAVQHAAAACLRLGRLIRPNAVVEGVEPLQGQGLLTAVGVARAALYGITQHLSLGRLVLQVDIIFQTFLLQGDREHAGTHLRPTFEGAEMHVRSRDVAYGQTITRREDEGVSWPCANIARGQGQLKQRSTSQNSSRRPFLHLTIATTSFPATTTSSGPCKPP